MGHAELRMTGLSQTAPGTYFVVPPVPFVSLTTYAWRWPELSV